ncbi:MAG: c-type cytochrome [Alphaproteobacteria bacterium]|nr:c-type cytochrome [Alphaproteobacteria bacterium]
MDGFEWNKIIGAVLGTALFVMGIGFLADWIYEPSEGAGGGFALPEATVGDASAPVEVAVVEVVPFNTVLSMGSMENGQRRARSCAACHTFEAGGGNKAGPPLFDAVGRVIGSVQGYSYSSAMAAEGEAGKVWDFESLDGFLTSPKEYMAGTKMGFSGIRSAEDRADLLVYMRSLSDNPVPLPAVEGAEAPMEAPEAPAETPAETPAEAPMETPAEAAPASDAGDGTPTQ